MEAPKPNFTMEDLLRVLAVPSQDQTSVPDAPVQGYTTKELMRLTGKGESKISDMLIEGLEAGTVVLRWRPRENRTGARIRVPVYAVPEGASDGT